MEVLAAIEAQGRPYWHGRLVAQWAGRGLQQLRPSRLDARRPYADRVLAVGLFFSASKS